MHNKTSFFILSVFLCGVDTASHFIPLLTFDILLFKKLTLRFPLKPPPFTLFLYVSYILHLFYLFHIAIYHSNSFQSTISLLLRVYTLSSTTIISLSSSSRNHNRNIIHFLSSFHISSSSL